MIFRSMMASLMANELEIHFSKLRGFRHVHFTPMLASIGSLEQL